MQNRIFSFIAKIRLGFYQWKTRFASTIDIDIFRIQRYSISLIGLLLSAFLLSNSTAQQSISSFKYFSELFIGIGAALITIITLIYSLSIIPIQRAAEALTPSIGKLYRESISFRWLLFFLSTLSLLSFLCAIEGIFFGITNKIVFPVEILFLSISIDIIRYIFITVSKMLEPSFALQKLHNNVKDSIKKTSRFISKISRLQSQILSSKSKDKIHPSTIESVYYSQTKLMHQPILNHLTDLSEVADRSISNHEYNTSSQAINAIINIAKYYLIIRKDNLYLYPDQRVPIVSNCDVEVILNPIYEYFNNLYNKALHLGDEKSAINIINSLSDLAIALINLKAQAFDENSSPIAYVPISYIGNFSNEAQKNNLDEVSLNGSRALLRISEFTPANFRYTDVHLPLSEVWSKISLNFILANKIIYVTLVTEDWMKHIVALAKNNHFNFVQLLENYLDKIYGLIPYYVHFQDSQNLYFPPYNPFQEYSLVKIIRSNLSPPEADEEMTEIKVKKFMNRNEVIYRHFRKLADNIDFKSSNVQWLIIETIKYISICYIEVIEKTSRNRSTDPFKLIDQLLWYLSFFWVSYSKNTLLLLQNVKHACDSLAWIGLKYYRAGFPFVATKCISNIISIIESYAERHHESDSKNIMVLMLYIRQVKYFAELRNDTRMIEEFNKKIVKPKSIPEEKWNSVLDELSSEWSHQLQLLEEYPLILSDNESLMLLQQLKNKS